MGLIHSHPATGASIVAQPAVKLVIVKSIQMASDFRQPFGSNLPSFEGGQAGGVGIDSAAAASAPMTIND
jgi:hypothetical protein